MVDAKRVRTLAKSKFTRALNVFTRLLAEESPRMLVEPQYETVKSCWESLEKAQDDYLSVTEDDIEAEGGLDYLDDPGEKHTIALIAYSAWLKAASMAEEEKADQKAHEARLLEDTQRKRLAAESKEAEDAKAMAELEKRFGSMKLEVDSGIDTFSHLTLGLQESLEDASDEVKWSEWEKVDSEFGTLKNKLVELVSMDSSKDLLELRLKFKNDAEATYLALQKWVLPQLKPKVVVDPVVKTSGGMSCSTRKEQVRLPTFKGDEKSSPFLQYPIWRQQWELLIVEYEEEKWWSGLLWDHLDEAARLKFVGYETNYSQAMERLDAFYGDPVKVVSCVTREVMAPRAIADGDYKSLLSYGVILENNFNRLLSIGREHELSNTTAMSAILKKFPRAVSEKWHESLTSKTNDEKAKPFPVFIEWMKSQKETWERIAATDVGRKGAGPPKTDGSFFVSEVQGKKCYSCGNVGHVRRDCPNRKDKKKRRHPKVKKFWCAYHKGDTHDHNCFTDSCEELKKIVAAQRIKLLKENGDCIHCCGDHKPEDCQKKDRVCGGRKDDRGCTKSHKVHELFCVEAKVFTVTTKVENGLDEGVMLLIMQVSSPKRGIIANVFWDMGSSLNFVREDFAKRCNNIGKREYVYVRFILHLFSS